MKKTKFLTTIIAFLAFVILNVTISSATDLSIKASSDTAKKDDTITITITGDNISGKVSLSVSGDASLSQKNVWIEDSSQTATLTINGTGDVTVTAQTEDAATSDTGEEYSKSVSTTIKVEEEKEEEKKEEEKPASSSKSSVATLDNLGITPNDFTGFRRAIESYNVEVPKNVDKVNIYAVATDKKADVSGTGSKNLEVGKNTFAVKVTAEDGTTTKTYTINITRSNEEAKSDDATLSILGLNPKAYDFTGFRRSITTYPVDGGSVEVENSVKEIYVYGYTNNEKATAKGLGNQSLQEGNNKLEVTVTAEDGKTTKTYVINVKRLASGEKSTDKDDKKDDDKKDEDKKDEKTTSGLTGITVTGYTLSPKFDSKTYTYNVELPEGTTKVDVTTEKDKDVNVSVAGNDKLVAGKNYITVLVTKGDDTETYQIVANVKGAEGTATTENTTNNTTNTTNTTSTTKKKDNKMLFAIIGIVIALVLIFFVVRYIISRRDDYYDDDDYYEDDEEEDNSRNSYYNNREEYRKEYLNKFLRDSENEEPNQRYSDSRFGRSKGRRFKD